MPSLNQNAKIIIVTIIAVFLIYTVFVFYYDLQSDIVQIANPATVFCFENDGTIEMVTTESGQIGMCKLANGAMCDEWEYFRGECS